MSGTLGKRFMSTLQAGSGELTSVSGRGRGRGAYFRAKYGGGGRGRGGGPAGDAYGQGPPMLDDSMPQPGGTRDWKQLTNDLKSIDGQQYGRLGINPSLKLVRRLDHIPHRETSDDQVYSPSTDEP